MSTPIPRAGQHLPGPHLAVDPSSTFADPQCIHAEVDVLLGRLGTSEFVENGQFDAIPNQARILEQAHDVLVQALATVDKI